MLQVFLSALSSIRRRISRLRVIESYGEDLERWRCDPLAHPALAAMDERQLADLPFEPRQICGG